MSDYLSSAVECRVHTLTSIPNLQLAVKKITEDWPGRSFTRITNTLYSLDGYIFACGNTFKVTVECGENNSALVTVSCAALGDIDQVVQTQLNKDFHSRFASLIATAIVNLINIANVNKFGEKI